MHGLDESTGLLSNVLWVPNLGVNLDSASKYGGFTGLFDDSDKYITKGNQVKIYAMLDGGLYVVNFIVDEYRQKAFTATLQPIHKLRNKDQQDAIRVNTTSSKTNKKITTFQGSNTRGCNYGNSDTDAYIETSSDSDSEKSATKYQNLIFKLMH
jgi:hypothetical protein